MTVRKSDIRRLQICLLACELWPHYLGKHESHFSTIFFKVPHNSLLISEPPPFWRKQYSFRYRDFAIFISQCNCM